MKRLLGKKEFSFQFSLLWCCQQTVWMINIVFHLTSNLFLLMDGMLQQQIIKSKAADYTDKKFISGYHRFDLSPFWLRQQASISVLTFQAGYRFHLSPKVEKKISP